MSADIADGGDGGASGSKSKPTSSGAALWKHIGLHGHSVGTFGCDDSGIVWKSALFGREDDGDRSSRSIPRDAIAGAQWTVFGKSGHLRIQTQASNSTSTKLHHELRFDGFPYQDYETLKSTFHERFDIDLQKYNMSAAGTQYGLSNMSGKKLTFRHCILEDADEEGEEFEPREGDEMLSLDLAEVSQCVLPGNNRNEIELQFPESDAVEVSNDQLVSIRFYIPPDPETDPSDRTVKTNAELLQQRIMATANIRKTTGDVIVEFDHEKGSFLTPRGRYSIELCKFNANILSRSNLASNLIFVCLFVYLLIVQLKPQTTGSFACVGKSMITRSNTMTFHVSSFCPNLMTCIWRLLLHLTSRFDKVNNVTSTLCCKRQRIKTKLRLILTKNR